MPGIISLYIGNIYCVKILRRKLFPLPFIILELIIQNNSRRNWVQGCPISLFQFAFLSDLLSAKMMFVHTSHKAVNSGGFSVVLRSLWTFTGWSGGVPRPRLMTMNVFGFTVFNDPQIGAIRKHHYCPKGQALIIPGWYFMVHGMAVMNLLGDS